MKNLAIKKYYKAWRWKYAGDPLDFCTAPRTPFKIIWRKHDQPTRNEVGWGEGELKKIRDDTLLRRFFERLCALKKLNFLDWKVKCSYYVRITCWKWALVEKQSKCLYPSFFSHSHSLNFPNKIDIMELLPVERTETKR